MKINGVFASCCLIFGSLSCKTASRRNENTSIKQFHEINTMNANPDGTWSVQCKNGRKHERVNEANVKGGYLCPSNFSSLSHSDGILCGIIQNTGGLKCLGSIVNFERVGYAYENRKKDPYRFGVIPELTSGVSQVVTDPYKTCAVHNGAGKCWKSEGIPGGTALKQLRLSGLESGVAKMSIGLEHFCALQNGGVKCLGRSNLFGQLGLGHRNKVLNSDLEPTLNTVPQLESGVTELQTLGNLNCVIQNSKLKCWGQNSSFPYNKQNPFINHPEMVKDTDQLNVTEIPLSGLTSESKLVISYVQNGANSENIKCIHTGDSVQCQGSIFSDQFITPPELKSGVTALSDTCAIVNNTVLCWTWGNGKLENIEKLPKKMQINSAFDVGKWRGEAPEVVDVVNVEKAKLSNLASYSSRVCFTLDGAAACYMRNNYNKFQTEGRSFEAHSDFNTEGSFYPTAIEYRKYPEFIPSF